MKAGQQGQIVARVYQEWAQEQAGKVTLDAAYAENDPTAYAETVEALGASDEAQADLLARTEAALAETGTPEERTAKAANRRRWARVRDAFAAALGAKLEALTASAAWREQLRIPKGNGDRSGRWTFTPWKHLDDLAGLLGSLGADQEPDAREKIGQALDALKGLDPQSIKPNDPKMIKAANDVADLLGAAHADDPSLASALKEATAGVREFADTDWTLFEEASDIGASDGGGHANRNVWEGDLPSDEAVNPDLADKSSQDLADELARIKAHPVAPSPTTRRRRTAYIKELQDRRDRDEREGADQDTDPFEKDKPGKGKPRPEGKVVMDPVGGAFPKNYVVQKEGKLERRLYEDGSVTFLDTSKPAGTNRTVGHTGPNPDKAFDISVEPKAEQPEPPATEEPLKPRVTGMSDRIVRDAGGAEVWSGDVVSVGASKNEWTVNHIADDGTVTLERSGRGLDNASDRTLMKYGVDPATTTLRRHVYERPAQAPAEPVEPPSHLDHKHQAFIDDAVAEDRRYDWNLGGVRQPGGPWRVVKGKRNGYIQITNDNGSSVDVEKDDLAEIDPGNITLADMNVGDTYVWRDGKSRVEVTKINPDGTVGVRYLTGPSKGFEMDADPSQLSKKEAPLSDNQQAAYAALSEAGDNVAAQQAALRDIRRSALFERAAQTTDVLPNEAWSRLTDLLAALTMDDDKAAKSAAGDLRAALQQPGVPERWKALDGPLADAFGSQGEADPLNSEMTLLHKIYDDKIRSLPTQGVHPDEANKWARDKIAALRGQLTEEINREYRLDTRSGGRGMDAEWPMRMDHRLEQAWQALKDGDGSAYFKALANIQKLAQASPRNRVGLPEPWLETAKALLEVEPKWQSLMTPESRTGPKNFIPTLTMAEAATNLNDFRVQLEKLYLKSTDDEVSGFMRAPGISQQLHRVIQAVEGVDEQSYALAIGEWRNTLKARAGLDENTAQDYWTMADEEHLDGIEAQGMALIRQAGAAGDNLTQKFGSLPESETDPLTVIADIGQFYTVRQVNSNCVLASTVYELRRRGINAHPKQAKKGRNAEYAQKRWFHLAEGPTVVDDLKGRRAKGRYEAIERHFKKRGVGDSGRPSDVVDNYPPGSRGTIRAGWKNRNFGHIWNWEVHEDGSLVFYDAQTGERISKGREDYWGEMDWRFVTVQRLDNAKLQSSIEVVLAPVEDASKITPEMTAYSRQLADIRERKRIAWEKYQALDAAYYKAPVLTAERERLGAARAKAREDWQVIQNELARAKTSNEYDKLRDVGTSFPFLDPDKYQM